MDQVVKDKRHQLVDRDREILGFIGEHGFASARWIRDRFWHGKANCHYYRRLGVLKQLGLVESLLSQTGHHLAYRLTKKGAAQVSETAVGRITNSYRANYKSTFAHDETLIGVSLVFSSLRSVSDYQTEAKVRQNLALKYGHAEHRGSGHKVPDGLFRLRTSKGLRHVALELEISPKSEGYRRTVLRKLVTSRDFDLVFMIIADSTILARYIETLAWVRAHDLHVKSSRRDNGIYFALLDEVLREKTTCRFTGEGQTFSLDQLAA